jgi:putative transposase
LSGENERIADWLVRLTHNQRNWGLWRVPLVSAQREGLRIEPQARVPHFRLLELNLRIKPKRPRRLEREAPRPLAVPEAINEFWSMDFMHDNLEDGRQYRLFNVIDDFNREGGVPRNKWTLLRTSR